MPDLQVYTYIYIYIRSLCIRKHKFLVAIALFFCLSPSSNLQKHLLKWFSLFTINSLLFILSRVCFNILNCLLRARHIYKHNWQLKLIRSLLLQPLLYFSCTLATTSLKRWNRIFCCLLLSALTPCAFVYYSAFLGCVFRVKFSCFLFCTPVSPFQVCELLIICNVCLSSH